MNCIYEGILCLAIVAIPFISSIRGIESLGGLGKQLSVYPLLLGLLVWGTSKILRRDVVVLPNGRSGKYLLLFIICILMSGIVNFFSIIDLHYQGETGIGRYMIQTGAFIVYVVFSIMMFNIIVHYKIKINLLQKCIYVSFIIAGIYSLFEVIAFINFDASFGLLSSIDKIFRKDTIELLPIGRVRSVTAEPSYFGMYAGMVLPWLVIGWINTTKHKFLWGIINVYFWLLVVLTFSRTAYVMTGIEMILIIFMFRKEIGDKYKRVIIPGLIMMGVMSYFSIELEATHPIDVGEVIVSLLDDSGENLSNVARYGSQMAAYKMFLDNPFFGNGFGLYGFYASDYYPTEAWRSVEIMEWGSNSVGNSWPPVHGLYARLLAETGIFGLVSWIAFFYYLIKELWLKLKETQEGKRRMQVKALFVSLTACVLCGGNVDAFTVLGMWIFIAFSWSIVSVNRYKDISE